MVETIVIHLGSGNTIFVDAVAGIGIEGEDAATAMLEELAQLERPCWMQVGNVCVFTGAVSGIEFLSEEAER